MILNIGNEKPVVVSDLTNLILETTKSSSIVVQFPYDVNLQYGQPGTKEAKEQIRFHSKVYQNFNWIY